MSLCVSYAKSLQLCPVLCNPMDYNPSGSSVHGILQARKLKWVAMPSSRGCSPSRDQSCASYVSCTGRWVLDHCCRLGSPYSLADHDYFSHKFHGLNFLIPTSLKYSFIKYIYGSSETILHRNHFSFYYTNINAIVLFLITALYKKSFLAVLIFLHTLGRYSGLNSSLVLQLFCSFTDSYNGCLSCLKGNLRNYNLMFIFRVCLILL